MALQHSMGGFAKSEITKIIVEVDDDEERELKEKFCYRCRKYYPSTADYFYRKFVKFDGLSDECKKCDNTMRNINRKKRKDN